MPKSVLTRKRSMIARFAVLAMIFSLMAVALPASAHSVAIDTTGPCPAATPSAGFTDIGAFDTTTQTAINCLFAFGITTGTSATTYSPNDTITRWQMALFLVRQLADHGVAIPAAVSQGYIDIGAHPASTQDAINQITQLGISLGTSSNTFSPNDGVTRWQMALFIYRTGQEVGVTFATNAAHNEFADILTLSAEAQTAINALADTEPDPAGHIALGTGTSLFSPNLVLVRWQMALFLTRLLAADDVAAPQGARVTVSPTTVADLPDGGARAYQATFKNADGSVYTNMVGVHLADVEADGTADYNVDVAAGTAVIESVDGVAVGDAEFNGFPGLDGAITFIVRAGATTGDFIPVVWEDLDGDSSYETVGDLAPTEPFALGGETNVVVPPAEAVAGAHTGVVVASANLAGNSFTGDDAAHAVETFNYDANDIYLIGGVLSTEAGFEAVLSEADVIDVTGYAAADAANVTFNIVTDNDPTDALDVTNPAAAVEVDAATFSIQGTGEPGEIVTIYVDTVNDGVKTAGDTAVGSGTIAAGGTWAVVVALTQNAVNDFVATVDDTVGGAANGTGVQVPLITEGPANAAALAPSTWAGAGATDGTLDVGDILTLNFDETVAAPGNGDTVEMIDADGTRIRLTCGTNATCDDVDADTITVEVDLFPEIVVAGGTAGLQTPGQVVVLGGFVGTDGLAVSTAGPNALIAETP